MLQRNRNIFKWIKKYQPICKISNHNISYISFANIINFKISNNNNHYIQKRNVSIEQDRKTLLYAKGCGVFGALGRSNLDDCEEYEHVEISNISSNSNIKQISSAWGHSAIITTDGKLYIFGRPYDFSNLMQINRIRKISVGLAKFVSNYTNFFGHEHENDTLKMKEDQDVGFYNSPKLIEGINDSVIHVSTSVGLTVVLTKGGDIYCFGLNRWGQCSVEDKTGKHIYKPTKVIPPYPCKFKQVDTGLQHCIALSDEGYIFTWGKGTRGQLGDGRNETSPKPIKLKFKTFDENGKKVDKNIFNSVSAGFSHSAALGVNGEFYVWGKGMSDIIRLNSDIEDVDKEVSKGVKICEDQIIPRKIELPNGRKAVELCSSNFTLVIRADDNTLWAMGMAEYDRNMSSYPLQVQQAADISQPVTIDENGSTNSTEPFVTLPQLNKSIVMKKGYQRVCLMINRNEIIDDSKDKERLNNNKFHLSGLGMGTGESIESFEVVLYRGEAFLQTLILNIPILNNNNTKGYKAKDYSSGWKHSLLLIEK